jgi:hypothetical protein
VLFAGHCYERFGSVKMTVECIHNIKWRVTKHGTVYSSGQELGFGLFGHSDRMLFRSDVFFILIVTWKEMKNLQFASRRE